MKKFLLLIAAVAMVLSGCGKIEESIDALGGRLDKLEQEAIPTIDEQISAINTTLGGLDAMDKELKGYIDNLTATALSLQEQINATNSKIDAVKAELQGEISAAKTEVLAQLESAKAELEGKLAQINATIETLKAKDAELDQKIADLRSYVDTKLGKTTDWVTATFATLEQLNSLSDEVATLKSLVDANKTEAATNLANAISALEISLKKWVGEQLSNYYTIAEIDAKILALQNALAEGDIALQEELNALKSQLETAKAELTEAYKKAIKEAIETNNGIIEGRIASEVVAINQRINSEVATLNQRIAEVERRLANLEGRVNTIEQQIVAINTTIRHLEKTDNELKGYIENLQATANNLQEQIDTTNAKIEEVKVTLQNEISTAKAEVLAELEALETELEDELAQINATIETIQAKDTELDQKIADLKTYVDTELGKTTDWANATFATLDQYNSLVEEVATINAQIEAINEGIYDLETRLTTKINEDIASAVSTLNSTIQQKVKEVTDAYTAAVKSAKEEVTSAYTAAIATAISNLETSLKTWVGEQLSNYYTIAEIDALLTTLEQEMNGKLEAQKTYLEGLINELSTATSKSIADSKALIDALRNDVTSLQGENAEQATKIAENATAIAENSQAIIDNAAAIAQNGENIEANAQLIANNKTLIEANAAAIAENKSALEALKSSTDSAIAQNATVIAKNAEDIAKNATLIAQNAIAINNNAEAIADNATEIANLKTSLETTKSEITEAYKKAIKDAIDTNNGVINGKIAAEVSTINTRINNEVATINTTIKALTERIELIESEISSIKQQLAEILGDISDMKEDIAKLLARIQSVSYIPKYSDGKATVKYVGTKESSEITIDFKVSPKECVVELAKVWSQTVKVEAIYTKTRAVSFVDMPVRHFEADEATGVITVVASGKNLSDDFFEGTQEASVALVISDGNNSVTSDYIPMGTQEITNEIWYTSTDGKVVTPYATDVFGANIVSNTYENGKGIITFDAPVTQIGDSAFYYCTSLQSFTIPNSVTEVEYVPFFHCTSLKVFYGKYAADNGRCLIKDNAIIAYANASGSTYTIPNNVTLINNSAFSGCINLISVTIPDSVTSIGGYAFYHCTSLQDITIPDSVTTIENEAFVCCTSIRNILIPESVTSIGDSAFYYCKNLQSVTIPDKVTEIGDRVFGGCISLKVFYGKYAADNGRCLIKDNAIIAYANASGTTYAIPEGVMYIRGGAFYQCSNLTSIIIPDSVTLIGSYAFYECKSLTSVYCNSITPPTGYPVMFGDNSSDRKIYVPASSVDAYKSASSWSEYAADIVADPHIICYTSTDGNVVTPNATDVFGANIVSNIYSKGQGIIVFDAPVTTIGEGAFAFSSDLVSITIPDSVTSIGEKAFYGCSSLSAFYGKFASSDNRCLVVDGELNSFARAGLTEYTIPHDVSRIGNYAFALNARRLGKITIPKSVESIGKSAFARCEGELIINSKHLVEKDYNDISNNNISWLKDSQFKKVTIGDEIEVIGKNTFYGCSNLTSVTIGNNVLSIKNGAFRSCSNLTDVTIGDSIILIEGSAFSDCSSLMAFYGKLASADNLALVVNGSLNAFAIGCGATTYIIPEGVTSIGVRAFRGCNSLTSITIPESVTSIEKFAFMNCDSLASVTIGNGVTSIGSSAFWGCNSLTSVYCKPITPPTGGSDMFGDNASDRKIYVPTSSVDAYKSASSWSEYAADIVGYDYDKSNLEDPTQNPEQNW